MKTKSVIPFNELEQYVQSFRTLKQTISVTQGVFDMIHIGHVRYLEEVKKRGDISIVCLDSDALTKARKGPTRPIVPEDERVHMLLALECVDYVVLRDNKDDADEIVKIIRPDFLIISRTTKDYDDFEKTIREKLKDFCKEIVCLDPQATTSTSARIGEIIKTGNLEKLQELSQDLHAIFQKHGLTFKTDSDEKS